MATQLNTQPVFVGSIANSMNETTNETSKPQPGSDNLLLLYEAGQLGAQVECIQIVYTNWTVVEPANKLFLYIKHFNAQIALFWKQVDIPANPSTNSIPDPVEVSLHPILYGENKRALRLGSGAKVYGALELPSQSGFNIFFWGGGY